MPSTQHRRGDAAPDSDRLRSSAVAGRSFGRAAALPGLLLLVATTACRTPTAAPIAPVAPTRMASHPAVPPLAPAPAPTAVVSPTLGVVATTSLVGDVVKAVGGERVAVHVLIGPDSDPHDYKPSPGDLAAIEAATIVFENGLHLEVSLASLLASLHPAGDGGAQRIAVSDGIATMRGAPPANPADNPHVWWDPVRVKVWVRNIAAALAAADPPGSAVYQANATAYAAELDALDTWIRAQTSAIPPDRRVLVTDHEVLGYFAAAYGFTEVGAVVPSVSTEAEPSAKDLAALEAAIAAYGVTAIFTGETVPTALSERVAADTGTRLVSIYAEALSAPDGPAGTYVAFMRHNVTTIVEALR